MNSTGCEAWSAAGLGEVTAPSVSSAAQLMPA